MNVSHFVNFKCDNLPKRNIHKGLTVKVSILCYGRKIPLASVNFAKPKIDIAVFCGRGTLSDVGSPFVAARIDKYPVNMTSRISMQ